MEDDLIDLPELSVRLEDLSRKLQQTKDAATINTIAAQIRDLMKPREEFYHLIHHGGSATGFRYSSWETIETSQKISALIKTGLVDKLEENKQLLIEHIDQVLSMISHNEIPSMDILRYFEPGGRPSSSFYFVSYSHKDEISRNIIPIILNRVGMTVRLWIDEYALKRHDKLPAAISNGIKESTASLLLLSENFLQSKFCNEEWNGIFMKRLSHPGYRLYIIRIDDEEYPPLLSSYRYTDCRKFPTPKAKVELGKLLREIQDHEFYAPIVERRREYAREQLEQKPNV